MWPFSKLQKNVTVNVNIDYDQLAEAVIKAQEKAQKNHPRENRLRGSLMAIFNAMLYFATAFVGVCMVICTWVIPIGNIGTRIVCTFLFGIIAIYSGACFYESIKDSDENAQQHFNTNITLIALIVALVALFKGVG